MINNIRYKIARSGLEITWLDAKIAASLQYRFLFPFDSDDEMSYTKIKRYSTRLETRAVILHAYS